MLYNLEAEQFVIAAVLMENDHLEVFTRLTPSHFYSPAHRTIFEAIRDLANKNTVVDLVTVSDRLRSLGKLEAVGGNEYLTTLIDSLPSTVGFKNYVAILKKYEILRRLSNAATAINDSLGQADDEHEALQNAEKLIFDISREDEKQELTPLADELPAVMDKFDEISHNPNALHGIQTGYTVLDNVTNGLQKGNLIILGARPSVGKTSLGLNIALHAAIKGKAKVAIFSLEMTKQELADRAMCSVARVSLEHAKKGKLKPEEWNRLWEAHAKLQKANIYLDASSGISGAEIMRKCMRLQRERGLDLVMVDYLGLMRAMKTTNRNENREQQVANNCRMMKTMAKDLQIPVLLLAQLNRGIEERNKDGKNNSSSEPMLADLRESGSIEQDADIVMFIHRPKTETPSEESEHSRDYEAKIIIAKNRHGPTLYFKLPFIGALTTFVNPEDVAKEKSVMATQDSSNQVVVPKMSEIVQPQTSGQSDVF